MNTEKRQWTVEGGWKLERSSQNVSAAQLVLAFGSRSVLEQEDRFKEMRDMYPKAHIVSCSTSGEIFGSEVFDETISLTATFFEKTEVKVASMAIKGAAHSFSAGVNLAKQLSSPDLAHVILISDGLNVNGSDLVRGIASGIPKGVSCTGGLAGDAARFEKTLVGVDAPPTEKCIVAVGLYGKSLRVGYGSVGGWDNFGAERLVTRSEGNVLYELDGQSALDLYKMYLGEKAKELPGSALLFPLGMKFGEDSETIVRTVLAVSEENQSMTFAGDIPEGSYVRLMKANFDRLIDGANLAAEQTTLNGAQEGERLAILISCVGRKLILGQRISEEVDTVRDVLGRDAIITGFYSYGEISPVVESATCSLHNQTMTITTLAEV
jgi:hypothetical protein